MGVHEQSCPAMCVHDKDRMNPLRVPSVFSLNDLVPSVVCSRQGWEMNWWDGMFSDLPNGANRETFVLQLLNKIRINQLQRKRKSLKDFA